MIDNLVEVKDTESLVAEVSRLRGEVRRLEERIELLDQLAHQDWLIDLPNRRGFMRQLEVLISRVSRHGESAAMLFVDVDGLKAINDSYGHKAGDEALIHVAGILAQGVRTGDCVARLGGDEFGILLNYADEASAAETARRLVDCVSRASFSCEGIHLPLSVAIGVSPIQADDEPEDVIVRADKAMYRDKVAA